MAVTWWMSLGQAGVCAMVLCAKAESGSHFVRIVDIDHLG